jgi:hypothetical protein
LTLPLCAALSAEIYLQIARPGGACSARRSALPAWPDTTIGATATTGLAGNQSKVARVTASLSIDGAGSRPPARQD